MAKKKNLFNLKSIRTQMILGSIALVIFSVLAAGLPAILLNQDQLDRQAWAQIDQGERAAKAIYGATQNELTSLATLTSQRPTLHRLLDEADEEGLLAYLVELQKGSRVDVIIVCGLDDKITSATAQNDLEVICQKREDAPAYFWSITGRDDLPVMFASQIISDDGKDLGHVIVGIFLDNAFALDLKAQTGLEHSIFIGDELIATSLGEEAREDSIDNEGNLTFSVDGETYYASQFSLDEKGIQAQVALPVGDILATQRRLALILFGSIITAALVASYLGAFMSRGVSRPLIQLADSASKMNKDNLDVLFDVGPSASEVDFVAQALENARMDLKSTLMTLQNERDWRDNLLESIVEGIITLDDQNQIQYFSTGAEQITGWQRDQVLDHSIDTFVKLAEGEEKFSAQLPELGEKIKVNLSLANERQATLAITGAKFAPTEIGESQIALVLRDVSEEEAINRLLGQFMSNVAHEFRTPLSALSASGELLLDQAADLSSTEAYELINSLNLGIFGLEMLIDNLLESASIEAKRFRVSPRPCDIGDVLADAIQTMNPLLKKYSQQLSLDLPSRLPKVHTDPRRTIQVMVNLLSNASKYGPSEGVIRISVKELDRFVRIEVADQGPGIPDDYKGDIFSRFVYPREKDQTALTGVGLGLSVVEAIVTALGGGVGVEDGLEGGAVFWFTIPVVDEI